jgi:hypothetical protein
MKEGRKEGRESGRGEDKRERGQRDRGRDLSVLFLDLIRTKESVEFIERDLSIFVVVNDKEETVELLVGIMEMQSTEEFTDVSFVEVALVIVVDSVEEILQQLTQQRQRQQRQGRCEERRRVGRGRGKGRRLTSRRAVPVTPRRLLALVRS